MNHDPSLCERRIRSTDGQWGKWTTCTKVSPTWAMEGLLHVGTAVKVISFKRDDGMVFQYRRIT